MEIKWSRWFRCESSFALLLVPNQPGIFALAEEIVQPDGPQGRRMLKILVVNEAEDLVRALNRLFTPGNPWRNRLVSSSCYVRYAMVPNPQDRTAAALSLRNWLEAQRETAVHVFEPAGPEAAVPIRLAACDGDSLEANTVAERAVDRVTRARDSVRAATAG